MKGWRKDLARFLAIYAFLVSLLYLLDLGLSGEFASSPAPYILASILAIAALTFWIWMLVECATKEPSEGNDKIVWILIILFTNLLGAIIYFLVRRQKRMQEFR